MAAQVRARSPSARRAGHATAARRRPVADVDRRQRARARAARRRARARDGPSAPGADPARPRAARLAARRAARARPPPRHVGERPRAGRRGRRARARLDRRAHADARGLRHELGRRGRQDDLGRLPRRPAHLEPRARRRRIVIAAVAARPSSARGRRGRGPPARASAGAALLVAGAILLADRDLALDLAAVAVAGVLLYLGARRLLAGRARLGSRAPRCSCWRPAWPWPDGPARTRPRRVVTAAAKASPRPRPRGPPPRRARGASPRICFASMRDARAAAEGAAIPEGAAVRQLSDGRVCVRGALAALAVRGPPLRHGAGLVAPVRRDEELRAVVVHDRKGEQEESQQRRRTRCPSRCRSRAIAADEVGRRCRRRAGAGRTAPGWGTRAPRRATAAAEGPERRAGSRGRTPTGPARCGDDEAVAATRPTKKATVRAISRPASS